MQSDVMLYAGQQYSNCGLTNDNAFAKNHDKSFLLVNYLYQHVTLRHRPPITSSTAAMNISTNLTSYHILVVLLKSSFLPELQF
eukprot:scaffold61705_cov59-Cyclotella_meneghiniana.AAC.1